MTVAALAADGVAQVELGRPRQAPEEAGAEPALVSFERGPITDYHPADKGDARQVDVCLSDSLSDAGPRRRRGPRAARRRHQRGPPASRRRRGELRDGVLTDLRYAGATGVDEEVVVDGNLLTGRKPGDLEAFGAAVVAEFAARSTGEPADA